MSHLREGHISLPNHPRFPGENMRDRPVFESTDGNVYYAPDSCDPWRVIPAELIKQIEWRGWGEGGHLNSAELLTAATTLCEHCEFNDCAECEERQSGPCCCGSLAAEWDCGSGQCDPNTGCPSCSDADHAWVRAR
jgi:hypothetical protein